MTLEMSQRSSKATSEVRYISDSKMLSGELENQWIIISRLISQLLNNIRFSLFG